MIPLTMSSNQPKYVQHAVYRSLQSVHASLLSNSACITPSPIKMVLSALALLSSFTSPLTRSHFAFFTTTGGAVTAVAGTAAVAVSTTIGSALTTAGFRFTAGFFTPCSQAQ